MNFVDIFVVILIGLFAFIGFRQGFIIQLFHAAGIFCAFWFNTPVSSFIASKLSSEPEGVILLLVGIAAFLLIFAAFYITGLIVSKTSGIILTSLPNRIAGIVFGGIKGFLIVTLFFLAVRSSGGDEFLKKFVTPDRATDELINRGLEYAKIAAENGSAANEYDETEDHSGRNMYSRLGYGAYRISQMMDPFVKNIKDMFREKYEEVIEEKIKKNKDLILED